MSTFGSVELLGFGFTSSSALPPAVVAQLLAAGRRRDVCLVDVLHVSKDARGILRRESDSSDVDARFLPSGSTLWELLEGEASELDPEAPFAFASKGEVGLDLAAVEGLAYRIEPGTSALLVLVEPRWATELSEVALAAGGFPIVFGCLEPETTLVLGRQLARASEASIRRSRSAAVRRFALLDALVTTAASPTNAAAVVRALVDARVILDDGIDLAIAALVDAGLVARSAFARATEHADDVHAEAMRTRSLYLE